MNNRTKEKLLLRLKLSKQSEKYNDCDKCKIRNGELCCTCRNLFCKNHIRYYNNIGIYTDGYYICNYCNNFLYELTTLGLILRY